MSRRLKGFRGLHFSLTKMHRSTEIFTRLSPSQQVQWSAFDRRFSRKRLVYMEKHGGGGGKSLI